MTLRVKIELIAAAVAIISIAFLLYEWHVTDKAKAVTEAQVTITQQKISDLQKQVDSDAKLIADDKSAMQNLQQQTQAAIASIKTPQQAQPIIIDWAKQNLPNPIEQSTSPNTGASTYTLTQDDVVTLGQKITACTADEKELGVCEHTTTDQESQIKDLNNELADQKKQTAQWETQAKGGTFWHKAKNDLKWLGYGAVVGGTIVAATKH